jgi:hypothetical protein
MIKQLRKRHLQVWSLWAVLLPLGIIGGIAARKKIPTENSLQTSNAIEQPVLLKEKKFGAFTVQLRTNKQGSSRQLVWINNKPLEVPTAAIYQSGSDTSSVTNSKYIGRIEGTGDYYFDLSSNDEHYILYDFIHQEIIGRVNLSRIE